MTNRNYYYKNNLIYENNKRMNTETNIFNQNNNNNKYNYRDQIKINTHNKLYNEIFGKNKLYYRNDNKYPINYNYLTKKEKLFDDEKSSNDNTIKNILNEKNNTKKINKSYIKNLEKIYPNLYKKNINKSKSYFLKNNNNSSRIYQNKIINYKFNSYFKKKYGKEEHKNYINNNNNNSDEDSSDSPKINELMKTVNYKGDKKYFLNYLKEIKVKSDITTIVQNMIKNNNYIKKGKEINKSFTSRKNNNNKKLLDIYEYLLKNIKTKDNNYIEGNNEKENNYDKLFTSRNSFYY